MSYAIVMYNNYDSDKLNIGVLRSDNINTNKFRYVSTKHGVDHYVREEDLK